MNHKTRKRLFWAARAACALVFLVGMLVTGGAESMEDTQAFWMQYANGALIMLAAAGFYAAFYFAEIAWIERDRRRMMAEHVRRIRREVHRKQEEGEEECQQ